MKTWFLVSLALVTGAYVAYHHNAEVGKAVSFVDERLPQVEVKDGSVTIRSR